MLRTLLSPRWLGLWSLATALTLTSGARAADAEPQDEPSQRSAAYFMLGLGAPVGGVGLEAVHRVGSLVEISAGVGLGATASGGQQDASFGRLVQWAVMPRLRLGNERHAFTAGVGASGGYFEKLQLFCDDDCSSPARYVLWANLEAGGEHWFAHGFALRYFVGYAFGCDADTCGSSVNEQDLRFPYTGIGVGYAF
jgi:hypothetical protein